MSNAVFGTTNWYAVLFDFIAVPACESLEPLFRPFEQAIRAAKERIDRYSDYPEWEAQAVIDDECGYIEDLLGAAFVVAQRYLTIVASRVLSLRATALEDGHVIALPDKNRELYANFGPSCPGAQAISFATGINAGANYFKHESEWPSWSSAKGQPQRTIDQIQLMGAEESSTGNCRTIAEALGVAEFDDLSPLITFLEQWKTALCNATRAELARLNLL